MAKKDKKIERNTDVSSNTFLFTFFIINVIEFNTVKRIFTHFNFT